MGENDGVPGLDRDTLCDDVAEPLHDGDGMVSGAARRAGEEQHEVGLRSCGRERLREQPGSSATIGVRVRDTAGLLDHRREHQRVGLDDLAVARLACRVAQLVAGGHDDDVRPPPDAHGGLADGRQDCEIGRAETPARGEQEVAGRDVLPHLAHVRVRSHGPCEPEAAVDDHVLPLRDRVRSRRQRVTRVDVPERPLRQEERGIRRRRGSHGEPVHRGGVEAGRRAPGPDRLAP